MRITSGYRTFAEQNTLFAIGRGKNKGKIVTDAKGGQSIHNYGLAIDIIKMNSNGTASYSIDWTKLVKVAKKNKFEWGNDLYPSLGDKCNFERNFGYSYGQLNKLYVKQKVKNCGYVDMG